MKIFGLYIMTQKTLDLVQKETQTKTTNISNKVVSDLLYKNAYLEAKIKMVIAKSVKGKLKVRNNLLKTKKVVNKRLRIEDVSR